MSRITRRSTELALGAAALAALWLLHPLATEPERPAPAPEASPTPSPARPASSPRRLGAQPQPEGGSSPSAEAGQVVLRARWGAGPDEVGRRGGAESSPEGPMSFDIAAGGRAVVLDQVNQRLQLFDDGAVTVSLPLPTDTYQDVAVGADGRVALLDRFGSASVTLLDDGGRVQADVALQGPGIDDPGLVTAVFQQGDGTWVEVGHEHVVRVADEQGREDHDRPTAPGRFSSDGSAFLRAARSGAYTAVVARQQAGQAPVAFAAAELDTPIAYINALEAGPGGRTLLGVSLWRESADPPHVVVDEAAALVVFDSEGREIRRLIVPGSTQPEETLRTVRFGPDGAIYRLELGAEGIVVRRFEV